MTPSTTTLLPILLALITAMLFGASAMVVRFGLGHTDPRTGSVFSLGCSAAVLWAMLPFFPVEVVWTRDSLLWFVLWFAMIGFFTPGISLTLAFEGNRRIGATISSTLSSTAPVFAVTSAVLILGEPPSLPVLLGTSCVVGGVIVLSWQGRTKRDWPLWAVLFPFGAAFLRGNVHMGTRYGLVENSAPFLAALVVFNAAFLVVVVRELLLRRGKIPAPGRAGFGWFALTGLLNAIAVITMNGALMTGLVTVASPIISTFPLFTFLFSFLLRIERLGPRALLGMALVVLGVVAITTR